MQGLLSAQAKAGGVAGEGHAYLKSPLYVILLVKLGLSLTICSDRWWTGMILMIVGEILSASRRCSRGFGRLD